MKTKITLAMVAVATVAMSYFQPANAQDWHLTGNAGTDPNIHFVGTTDNKGLVFRTQNKERMRIGQGGFVGIGISQPKTNLHVFRGNSGVTSPNANSPFIV